MPSLAFAARGALAAALLAATAACSSTSTDVTGAPTYTYVRIVQAVSDAANGVDLAIGGTLVAQGVPLGSYLPTSQGQYVGVPVSYQYAFAASGGAAFYNQAPALAANLPYTFIAYGRVVANATPPAAVAVLADTASDSTRTVVLTRVFNALDYVRPSGTTGGTPVDVYVYPSGGSRPTTPTLPNVAFGTRSAYASGTAGTLRVDVLAAGTPAMGTPLFTGTVSTTAGSVRTLVLVDPSTASGAATSGSLLVLNDYR